MRFRVFGLSVALLFLSLPAATEPVASGGRASYYHDKFHGLPTASGEPYDAQELTAAHRTFAFGTRLRVTRPDNGQSVEVRVNDRGPHSPGRVIDLSRRAAEQIDLLQAGIAEVEIEVLSPLEPGPDDERDPPLPTLVFPGTQP